MHACMCARVSDSMDESMVWLTETADMTLAHGLPRTGKFANIVQSLRDQIQQQHSA